MRAAKQLGIAEVPCALLSSKKWSEEDLRKFVTVRLNVIGGKLDPGKMAALYDEMAKKYERSALQNLFAYTDSKAWGDMLKHIGRALKADLPPEKAKEFEEKAKHAKSVKDIESILNELFASYGDTVQQSFMIFTYGTKEHIYIQMNKETRKAMKVVTRFCAKMGKDINDLVGVAMRELSKALDKDAKSAPKDSGLF